MQKTFAVYKGLQKPLVFKGFKGKFIFWGLGCLVTALVAAVLTMTLFNTYLGVVVLIAVTVGGFIYISNLQKTGLHDKGLGKALFIFPARIKNSNKHAEKTNF